MCREKEQQLSRPFFKLLNQKNLPFCHISTNFHKLLRSYKKEVNTKIVVLFDINGDHSDCKVYRGISPLNIAVELFSQAALIKSHVIVHYNYAETR